MDMSKVIIKFKMNAKGTHHVAYCDEYPQLQGIGPSEGQATANFWKAFNNNESKSEHEANQKKKMEASEKDKNNKNDKRDQKGGTKKKAA